jgi:hypothetical protein
VPLGDQGQFLVPISSPLAVAIVLPGLICSTRIQNISPICSPKGRGGGNEKAAMN